MESVVENVTKEGKFVDRSKICPVLIRVFVGEEDHNPLHEYTKGNTPPHELQLYTWMDTSLKELMGLIRSMGNLGRSKGSSFDFTVVYADPKSPNFKMRDIGNTVVGEASSDDTATLSSKKFQYGDFLDVSISTRRRQTFRNNNTNRFNNNRSINFDNRFNIQRNDFFDNKFNAIRKIDDKGGRDEGIERVVRDNGNERIHRDNGVDRFNTNSVNDRITRISMNGRGSNGEKMSGRFGDEGRNNRFSRVNPY